LEKKLDVILQKVEPEKVQEIIEQLKKNILRSRASKSYYYSNSGAGVVVIVVFGRGGSSKVCHC
jgi:hypothetical protein